MLYRKEIDGIRALAVIPVILFHAGFWGFNGGYVGVDVFFVISGYLIASVILEEIESGRFSLIKFYERRVRRILPALLFVMVVCVPFAWYWMMPNQLKDFSQSLSATAIFASNFLFWIEDGYFSVSAEHKPLLHTWSLAIEEQFYLLFPLTVIFLWRFARGWLIVVICLIALLSFGLSEWVGRGTTTNIFYLTHLRAWELLIGALLGFYLQKHPTNSGPGNEIGSGIGLLCVVVSVAIYNRSTPYPSAYTLLPTLGTLLLIYFATPKTLVGRLLSTKVLVGIGLISYSFYLWHQPLFAFARLRSPSEPPAALLAMLIVVALILAYFSWRFVERPFRNRDCISRQQVFVYAGTVSMLCIASGVLGHISNGFSFRLTEVQLADYQRFRQAVNRINVDDGECKFLSENIDMEFKNRFVRCLGQFQNPVLIFGDSHARDLFNALALVSENPFVVGVAKGWCRVYSPLVGCPFEEVRAFVTEHSEVLGAVIYSQKGSYFLHNYNTLPINRNRVLKVKTYLASLKHKSKIIWVGPQIEPNIDLRNFNILFSSIGPNDAAKENDYIRDVDQYLKAVNKDQIVDYVSKIDLIQYKFDKDFIVDGQITYSDTDHWSFFGAQYYGVKLMHSPILASVLSNDD